MSIRETLIFLMFFMLFENQFMEIHLPDALFMPQSVNGIHAGGLQGRKIPENNAHSRREEKRNNDDGEVRDKRNRQHL